MQVSNSQLNLYKDNRADFIFKYNAYKDTFIVIEATGLPNGAVLNLVDENKVYYVTNGDTVTLLKDVVIEETIVISKNVKIDLADFSIVNEIGAIFETADGMGMSYAEGVYTFAEIAVIADIDASGKVDSNDLVYVRQMLLSKLNKVYDINGDGVADIRDLVRIKKLAGE